MTTARSSFSSPTALAAWVVFGVLTLPLLQLFPMDFERTAAPLAFAPALLFGWKRWSAEAGYWLAHSRVRLIAGLAAGVIILSTVFAAHPAPALVQVAHGITLVALALLASGLSRAEPRAAGWILLGIVGGGLFGAATLAWPWLVHSDPRNAPTARFHWLYPHLRHSGLHLLPAAAIVPLLLLCTPNRLARAGLWLGAICLATALIWSGGRTPLLGIGAAAGIALWHAHGTQRRGVSLAYGLVFAAGLAASTLFWTNNPELGWWRAWQTSVSASGANELSSSRLDIWRACARFIADSPWLGYGPDGYRFLNPKMDAQQPHNALVQCALAVGIPGLLLGLALLARLLNRPVRPDGKPPSTTRLAAVAVIAALAAAGLTDGSLYHVLCTHAFALAAGLILSSLGKEPRDTTESPAAHWRLRSVCFTMGAATIVLGLHAWLFHQVSGPISLAPTSATARILWVFPSTTFGLDRSLEAWADREPETALVWARWAQRHSAYAWLFHLRAARILAKEGRTDEALAEFQAYDKNRPGAFREPIPR